MRCFIATDVPDSVRDEALGLQRSIAPHVKATYVAPDNLHITLLFLGNLPEERVRSIRQSLREVSSTRVNVRVTGVGGRMNRALWMNCEGPLVRLHKEIRNKLNMSTERFSPHITFARVKQVIDEASLALIMRSPIMQHEFVVDSFSLIASELTSQGPVYSEVERYPLEQSSSSLP